MRLFSSGWNLWSVCGKARFYIPPCSAVRGRALFYMVLGLLSFSDFASPMKVIAGLYAIVLACCMLYISRTARNKLLRIDVFVSQGAEGQQRLAFIEAKYDELNTMNGLTIDEVIKVTKNSDNYIKTFLNLSVMSTSEGPHSRCALSKTSIRNCNVGLHFTQIPTHQTHTCGFICQRNFPQASKVTKLTHPF